jgi:RNA polymerase sigma factor for flagellar operon FliA
MRIMRAKIKKYQQNSLGERGNLHAKHREELVLKYAPLVKYISERIAIRLPINITKEELNSAGILGLFDALDKFDSGKGIKFETYAEHRIRGAILDELRKMDWLPRSIREDIRRIENAIIAARTKLGREPEDFEVAQEMGIEMDAYHKIISRAQGVSLLSLDDPLPNGSMPVFAKQVSDTPSPLDDLTKKEMKEIISEAIACLPKKEQLVLSLYYHDELTLKEIAKVLDLTESRISQIHSKAIISLRTKLRGSDLNM